MIYRFAAGSGFSGDAQATYQELENLRQQNGGQLKTAEVVDAARDNRSALHPHFEWDNHKAAEMYRQNTARRLVRAVIVKPEENDSDNNPRVHRAFISVQSIGLTGGEGEEKPARYYQNISEATHDEFESAISQFNDKLRQLSISLRQVEYYASTEAQKAKANTLVEKTRELQEAITLT